MIIQPAFDFFRPSVEPVRSVQHEETMRAGSGSGESRATGSTAASVTGDPWATRRAGYEKGGANAQNLWRAMLRLYREHGPMSDAWMAYLLSVERTTVNARRNELIAQGLVKSMGKRKNERTGVPNTLWGLVA